MNCDEFYKSIQEVYHIEDETTVIKIPFENIIKITSEELFYKILSELADVEITLAQIKMIYNIKEMVEEHKDAKLKRFASRIARM